jgi:N,N-dimethylformamidase beta subunit-like, C-terminal
MRGLQRLVGAALIVGVLALVAGIARDAPPDAEDGGPVASSTDADAAAADVRCDRGHGIGRKPQNALPTVEVAFARESYRPGQAASLKVFSAASRVSFRIFRAGTENHRLVRHTVMAGTPAGSRVWVGGIRRGDSIRVEIGRWPSGLYFAKVMAFGGRVGYAPFVVRPRSLGRYRVAVVLPTQTWQAYNYRDDDRDGTGDTWYCSGSTARLARPFEERGVPPWYRYYDQPFLRWLQATGREADYLADLDLDVVGSGDRLRRAYELVVFPGHHEYVTEREFRAITRYRDLGGNLAFLSANNFYWRIEKRDTLMIRTQRWRDLGRPEASLVGVQYVHSDGGDRRGPWIVRNTRAAPWLFAGTPLVLGSKFGNGGLEADSVAGASPRRTKVVAVISNATGIGYTAHMTYYQRGGAKVFAAGAFSLAAGSWNARIQPLLANLWNYLSAD